MNAPIKHSAGINLWHVIQQAEKVFFLDNAMPVGDLSVDSDGESGQYKLCP